MMLRHLSAIVFCVLLTALGLGAGWQFGQHAVESHEHDEHDEHDDDHDDHAAEHEEDEDHDHEHEHEDEDGEVALSEQTLRTLGVRTEALALTDYVRAMNVRAVLVDRPENHRGVVAPIGGIVRDVHVESGAVVEAGAPLLTFARDPIPLAGRDTVMDIVLPVRHAVHEAVSSVRSARTGLKIAEGEITRVKRISVGQESRVPGLFASRLVELGYDRDRAARRMANAQSELRHHGLTEEEIEAVSTGAEAPEMLELWRRVLNHSGFWGEVEEALLAELPASVRSKPWPLALIAELSLQGLAQPALLALLQTHPAAVRRFREVAALLLTGRPIESVAVMADMGALEPDVVLRAPRQGATHWDVERLLAKAGQSLRAGEVVADLHDPRRLWMRVEPIGGEVAQVRRAVQEHLVCEAVPVLPDSAPILSAVHLRRLARHQDHGAVAYAEIENRVLLQEDGRRSWSLHAGTAFLVRVPLETLKQRFVLPAEAVVRHGPDRVVYILEEDDEEEEDHHDDEMHEGEDHDHHHFHFHPVPVHVELDTEDRVVIAVDEVLRPGQIVVVEGAFALHLALQQGRGGDDAHGHGHSHH